MIDIVMLLIVFFTMTSTFSRSEQKPLDLPQERGSPVRADDGHTIFLDVDRDGVMTILGEPVELGALASTVRGGSPAPAEGDAGAVDHMEIVVRADRTCPTAHLNRIAAELLKGGISRWKLATAPDGQVGVEGGAGEEGG